MTNRGQALFWDSWTVVDGGIFFLDTTSSGPPPCTVNFLDFQTWKVTILTTLDALNVIYYQGLAVSPDRQRILYPQVDQSAGEITLANRPPM